MSLVAVQNSNRLKVTITVTAGTPIFIASGQTPILADRLIIQMLHGGTGYGLVYDDVPIGMTAAQVAAGGDVAVELAPATATAPGGAYTDAVQNGSIDLRMIAVDGSNTGDHILVDAHLKI